MNQQASDKQPESDKDTVNLAIRHAFIAGYNRGLNTPYFERNADKAYIRWINEKEVNAANL